MNFARDFTWRRAQCCFYCQRWTNILLPVSNWPHTTIV